MLTKYNQFDVAFNNDPKQPWDFINKQNSKAEDDETENVDEESED